MSTQPLVSRAAQCKWPAVDAVHSLKHSLVSLTSTRQIEHLEHFCTALNIEQRDIVNVQLSGRDQKRPVWLWVCIFE